MQALLEKLMANYRQDILDLEEHYRRAEELEKLLKQENAKTPSQKRNEFFALRQKDEIAFRRAFDFCNA